MAAKPKPKPKAKPGPKTTEPPPPVPPPRTRGVMYLALGAILVVAQFAIVALAFESKDAGGAKVFAAYGPILVGFALLARGAIALSAPFEPGVQPQRDPRRWIYGGLAIGLAIVQGYCAIAVIPNRFPSAAIHLWSFPVLTFVMGVATMSGLRIGWWIAVIAGGAIMLSTLLVVVRILVSVGFLAGVYGAFGKAAAQFAFVSAVMVFQGAALLPMFHIRWLMSRRGKRAFGV